MEDVVTTRGNEKVRATAFPALDAVARSEYDNPAQGYEVVRLTSGPSTLDGKSWEGPGNFGPCSFTVMYKWNENKEKPR